MPAGDWIKFTLKDGSPLLVNAHSGASIARKHGTEAAAEQCVLSYPSSDDYWEIRGDVDNFALQLSALQLS